jgi:hypothetical protein
MTTLVIDDALGAQARRTAEAQGLTLDQFVGVVLQRALAGQNVQCIERNGLPVFQVTPSIPIDPQTVGRALQEEGF